MTSNHYSNHQTINQMNKYKYFAETKKLFLDIPDPNPSFYYDDEVAYRLAFRDWENRLHYTVSPELDKLLVDGQVLKENEFEKLYQELFVGNYVTPTAWLDSTEEQYKHLAESRRRIIAIPLPEAKTDEDWIPDYNSPKYLERLKELNQTIKPQEDKPERFMPPDNGDICWQVGAESFTRKEVAYLLYTQRAMIGNDLKSYCGNEMTKEMFDILDKPRTPNF